jgi:hypothetical protein
LYCHRFRTFLLQSIEFHLKAHSVPTDFGVHPSSTYRSSWFLHSISTVKVFLAHKSFLLSSHSTEIFFSSASFLRVLVASVATAAKSVPGIKEFHCKHFCFYFYFTYLGTWDFVLGFLDFVTIISFPHLLFSLISFCLGYALQNRRI